MARPRNPTDMLTKYLPAADIKKHLTKHHIQEETGRATSAPTIDDAKAQLQEQEDHQDADEDPNEIASVIMSVPKMSMLRKSNKLNDDVHPKNEETQEELSTVGGRGTDQSTNKTLHPGVYPPLRCSARGKRLSGLTGGPGCRQ